MRNFQIQETKKLGVLKRKMITKIEFSDSYTYFLIPNLKKIEFRKEKGVKFRGDKKLGTLKGKMITIIEFLALNRYFLIPNLKKIEFKKKKGFQGDLRQKTQKKIRCSVGKNEHQK